VVHLDHSAGANHGPRALGAEREVEWATSDWPPRTNFWRERTNPLTGSERLRGSTRTRCVHQTKWEKTLCLFQQRWLTELQRK
jgi:hypothetical protein